MMNQAPDGTLPVNDDDPVHGGLGSPIAFNPAGEGRFTIRGGSINASLAGHVCVNTIEGF